MRIDDIEKSKFTPMMQQYIDIKMNYKDAIVFFRLGDFYEMFFEDALIASRELEIALTGRDAGQEERVPMCGIPFHAYTNYAEKLISKGYKVAIVEQVEDAKSATTIVKRDVVKILTPGTIIEGSLSDKDNNFIVSIGQTGRNFSLAYADVSTGEIYLTTLTSLDLLVNEILILKSKEIIVSNDFSPNILKKIQDNYQILLSYENNKSIPKHLNHIMNDINQIYYPVIGILLNYIVYTQKRELYHLQNVKYYEASDYLRLDPFTKRNLELTETLRQGQKNGSLIWLLDKCQTAMGSRMLHKWINRPLVDIFSINKRLDYVQAYIDDYINKEETKNALKTIYDLERIVGRISVGNANAKDLVQLRRSLSNIPTIKTLVAQLSVNDSLEFSNEINTHDELYNLLEVSLVDNPPLTIKEGQMIKDGYNSELDEIKDIVKNSKQWILDYEEQEKQKTGIKGLKVGYNRVFGYYIEITKSYLSMLSEDCSYERKQTLANAERFITPELKHYEQIVVGSSEKIEKLEYELFIEIRNKCLDYISSLQDLSKLVATIDCYISFSDVSIKNKYVRPSFEQNREITIINGRHPVVETILSNEFVSNDVIINHYNTLLITGPNMSGKSTYMRQIALISIMAQIGCFVPADVARLVIFDQIFTRIGSSDDLISGQSTFMVEMMEANYAITNATKNSLILFDELGRGTSTFDGMAIAQSIIEYVHEKIGCMMIFSTHYHELIKLETTLKRLKNIHVDAKEVNNGVVFLHKVVDGGADKSYGINVASLAGLPKSVIARSKKVLETLESSNTNDSIKLDLFNFDKYEEEEKIVIDEKALELKQIVLDLDINQITPIEAMNILFSMKNKL